MRNTANYGLLERGDEVTNTEARATQIDQWIDYELTRTVIGDLSAAIDANDWNVTCSENMRGIGIHAEREYRFVFEHPDFIGRLRIAQVGEALHRLPRGQVIDAAEFNDAGWQVR
jgi:hypothetical protein